MIVTVDELAKIFQLTPRRVQQYADDEGMPRAAHGEYDALKCCAWYIRKLKAEIEDLEKTSKEDLEIKKLRIEHDKVKINKLINKLVDRDKVQLAWLDQTTTFRKNLQSLVFRLSGALEGIDDKIKRDDIISREIRVTMEKIGDLNLSEDEPEDEEEINLENTDDTITDESI